MKTTETKFRATLTVHWPSGPVNCCEDHAQKLVALGNFLGSYVALTNYEGDDQCRNCINEAINEAKNDPH